MYVKLVVFCLLISFVTPTTVRSDTRYIKRHTEGIRDEPVKLWPLPQQVSSYNEIYQINSDQFQFAPKTQGSCKLLDKALKRYKSLTFLKDCSRLNGRTEKYTKSFTTTSRNMNQLNFLNITINQKCEELPHMNMDEMYRLVIKNGQASLFSESIWGALRGLETFSQLVQHVNDNVFVINSTYILDYPRFSHRGVMLDSSRHYVPLRVLLDNLDAMTYNKFNVFHWHIVDDNSFPYVSKRFPNLSLKGAYNPQTHIYTNEQIQQVIDYATERGIRVVVEFDSPGHTESWGKGQPDLLTPCYSGGVPNGEYGPVDPINNSTYTFISQLFNEVVNVFPDQYFHVGGDEVDFTCWESNPNITEYMKRRNFTNYATLEGIYIQKVLDIVKNLNRSYIVWQEVFDNGVNIKPDTVVHVWKDGWQNELYQVTKSKYHALLSSCWYLNYIKYGTDWNEYYKCDPQNFNGTDTQNSYVLGGEACMWGEWVDGSNLISRTWPRAISVAERLWSSKNLTDPSAAEGRFNIQHCRMQQRGIKGQPNDGPGFCKCDYAL